MRKMSKSRTEEDAVSSTNGSVKTDEVANGGTANDTEVDDKEDRGKNKDDSADDTVEDTADDKTENDTGDTPRDPPKKFSSKARAKETKTGNAEEEEYEVENILDSKKIRGKLHYLIHWKGWSAADDTWEPADTVSCPELIKKFEESEKNGPKNTVKRKAADSTKNGSKRSKTAKITKKTKSTKTATKKKEDFDYENAEESAEYEVERILEVHHKKNGNREFLIHWKGWSSRHDSWEPEEHLNCSDLIKKFMVKVSSAREKDKRELRVAPETTQRFTLAQASSGRRLSKRSNQRQRVRYDNAE